MTIHTKYITRIATTPDIYIVKEAYNTENNNDTFKYRSQQAQTKQCKKHLHTKQCIRQRQTYTENTSHTHTHTFTYRHTDTYAHTYTHNNNEQHTQPREIQTYTDKPYTESP